MTDRPVFLAGALVLALVAGILMGEALEEPVRAPVVHFAVTERPIPPTQAARTEAERAAATGWSSAVERAGTAAATQAAQAAATAEDQAVERAYRESIVIAYEVVATMEAKHFGTATPWPTYPPGAMFHGEDVLVSMLTATPAAPTSAALPKIGGER